MEYDFSKKTYWAGTIFIALMGAVLLYVLVYVAWVPKRVVEDQSQTQNNSSEISDWKTYRNDEYGFEFQYPASFSQIKLNQDFILFSSSELEVSVINGILDKETIEAEASPGGNDDLRIINIGSRQAYVHHWDYRQSTWDIMQVSINDSHYLEVDNGGYPTISDDTWNEIISSFKFTE